MPDEPKRPEDMTDEELAKSLQQEFDQVKSNIGQMVTELSLEQVVRAEDVYFLWLCWGDFHVYIDQPVLEMQLPPLMIQPEIDPKTKKPEHVYPIADYGSHLSTSPGEALASHSHTTGMLLNTVEKMMKIAIERAKDSGVGTHEEEIKLRILGIEPAQRKAYELCLDTKENVLVTNFDAGDWGDRFLNMTRELLERGYTPKNYNI